MVVRCTFILAFIIMLNGVMETTIDLMEKSNSKNVVFVRMIHSVLAILVKIALLSMLLFVMLKIIKIINM